MEDIQAELKAARERLAAFEESSSRDFLMERLRRESPGHPVLLGRNLSGGAALLGVIAAIGTMIASIAVPGVNKQVHAIDTALGFPAVVALFVLSLCFVAIAVAMHQLALGAARNAPLLPQEAKQHQRLVADVKQLESRLALEGTPRPVVRVQH